MNINNNNNDNNNNVQLSFQQKVCKCNKLISRQVKHIKLCRIYMGDVYDLLDYIISLLV
jgi:hypothetical protein